MVADKVADKIVVVAEALRTYSLPFVQSNSHCQ